MMRKIFGVKSITHLIYGLLMLVPFIAIGVKCAYVVINKNAYQSASITKTYNEAVVNNNLTNDINTWNDIVEGNFYQLDFSPATTTTDLKVSTPATYTIAKMQNINLFGIYASTSGSGFNLGTMGGGVGGLGNRLITSGRNIYHIQITNKQWWLDNQSTLQTNIPTFILSKETNTNFIIGAISVNEITAQSLDNVFNFAIDEIIQDNNFGKINFTGWFDNMMLDNNIQINQTYTHLFNWYLNYALFISCAYILWLVLMWFVNFARKLLDRGMNYDW